MYTSPLEHVEFQFPASTKNEERQRDRLKAWCDAPRVTRVTRNHCRGASAVAVSPNSPSSGIVQIFHAEVPFFRCRCDCVRALHYRLHFHNGRVRRLPAVRVYDKFGRTKLARC